MNKELVKRPIVTEKTTAITKNGKYVFLVDKNATAPETKKVVETLYNVKVRSANVINVKSKKRVLGRSIGIKSGYKKIIVTLQRGQKLDIIAQ